MFSKKAPQAPRATQARAMANSTFSVFGPDIRIKGDVAASADLHIDGHVEGDVACTALVQGESGEIIGAVRAESARLSGTVRGTINVRELVVLKTARIQGDVHYDALTIEQGAQVDGRFAPRAVGENAEVVSLVS
jgi:cytoskeletal protein CcmA (bactofilin family)